MSHQSKENYLRDAREKWQDRCRVVSVNGRLIAMPYLEAAKEDDYVLGATIASITANRMIRKLLENSKPVI